MTKKDTAPKNDGAKPYRYEGPAATFGGVARGGDVHLTDDQVIWSGLNGGHTFSQASDPKPEPMPADDPFSPDQEFVGVPVAAPKDAPPTLPLDPPIVPDPLVPMLTGEPGTTTP